MALTYEAYRDLVQGLREHPEWREELRPLVLGDEVVAIPARMDRVESRMAGVESRLAGVESMVAALAEAITRLEAQTAKNSEAIERLIVAVDTLNGRVSSIDGRVGNLEGWRLEERYFRYVFDWFDEYIESPERVSPFQLTAVRAAVSTGQLLEGDRQRLRNTDIFVRGGDGSADGVVLAGAISVTISSVDVERADRSADILRKLGIHALGFVGGHSISDAAAQLATEFNVLVDLRRPKG